MVGGSGCWKRWVGEQVPGQTRRDGGGHLGGVSWFSMKQHMADLFVQPALDRGHVPTHALNILAAFAITISVTIIILIYVSHRWHKESCVLLLFAV